MKITGCKYASITLKFRRPFAVSRTVLTERKILFIRIENEDGIFSYGEASPLPEFGSETFEESEYSLRNILPELRGKKFENVNSIQQYLNAVTPPAAARFALEEALTLLLANNNIQELTSLLKLNARSSVRINAALGFLNAEEYIPRIITLMREGYSTIKVKVGRDNFDDDLRILGDIRKHFGDKIILRADVNGKWNIEEAISNIRRLDELGLEYIEQPVNTLNEFLKLKRSVKTPLAVDESIRSLSEAMQFIEEQAVNYIILKPALTGGIFPSLSIISEAKKKNLKIILSSSFETITGAVPSLLLAASLDKETAHGYGVFNYFESDPFAQLIPLKNGLININDIVLQNIYSVIEKNISFINA